ncbi:unnamed protein product [marine sediment metagenome]|uniref:Uncharacterized protein n=1 Tax=marine sediment metagenome TaxID=412755 RepID=X1CEE2_9ZZZZ
MTNDELEKIENLVNEKILDELKVETKISTLDKAREMGAIALFGEKYDEQVRVVKNRRIQLRIMRRDSSEFYF